MSIKLISVNVERSKHLDRVLPFIERERPDVLCVQEMCEGDIPLFVEAVGSVAHTFSPMVRQLKDPGGPVVGVAIFSRLPVKQFSEYYYVGRREIVPELDHELLPTDWKSPANCVLNVAEIGLHHTMFRIGSPHL